MEESRSCPYCGKEMRKGKLSAGGRRIFWTRRAMKLTSMARMGDIPMSPDYWHGNVENAFLCPRCKKVIASFEKVENVVKPPQKPTTAKSRTAADALPDHFARNPPKRPISNEPATLTPNVPHGNKPCPFSARETTKRQTPPRALPSAT